MRHGSRTNPPNRFESIHQETDLEHLEWDREHLQELENRRIEYISDSSKTIVSRNDSPDLPFTHSVNPYRGCIHACSYCYARPTHEYLGFNAGLDFETKIVVKHEAPSLLREFLAKPSWTPKPITFSGVTDCYQPAERLFRLTRQCLELLLQCRHPVSIVTKNALVARDLDILEKLAKDRLVHVFISLTSLDSQLARDMEPRTSVPSARLRAIGMLAEAGVPVGVMLAPIIPGLNDSEIPAVLQAAKDAGAQSASYILLRLPQTVEPVFLDWLARMRPLRAERVLGHVRSTRGGKLNSSVWGERMVGLGELARQIRQVFSVFQKKVALDAALPPLATDLFRRPPDASGQLSLFDS